MKQKANKIEVLNFNGVELSKYETEDGFVGLTAKDIAKALNITEAEVNKLYQENKSLFKGLTKEVTIKN